jgi:hypothetical protein
MSIIDKNVCEYCQAEFKTKQNLKIHITKNKKCLKNRGIPPSNPLEYKCLCKDCNYSTFNKYDLNKHIDSCKKLKMYNEIVKIQHEILKKDKDEKKKMKMLTKENEELYKKIKEKEIIMIEKDKFICQLLSEKEKDRKHIEHLLHIMEKAVSTSSTTNINNTTMNVKGNQTIQNILSDKYDQQTDTRRIEDIARNTLEQYFWLGQKGIAQFCLDHIVKTPEGKMVICCTDPSRKRFKYLNADKEMKEDIEARIFTQKISVPIKTVCEEVFDTICKKIEDEREVKKDAFDLNFLDHKKVIALEKMLEISNVGDNQRNTEYKTELCTLIKIKKNI